MLVVIETHPVQYHAPVYRAATAMGVPVTAIYGSDFSVMGYHDEEFNASFAWDTDLLQGYDARFLSRVSEGGAASHADVSTRGLRRALRELRPSAVLIVGYSPRFHRGAWFEAWRGGYPVLFRGETSDVARDHSAARDRIRHAALHWAYRRCAQCLYIGEHARAHYSRHGVPDERMVFSPYCVDVTPFDTDDAARDRWRASVRASLGIPADHTVVLFSGKLSHRKGVDLLARAVGALPAATRPRTVIVWLGDGEERQALERMTEGPEAVQMRFVGFQNQRALSRFYHAADVLALPSRHSETWGLVVNEALHHGLPVVVSTRVGCAPDLVDAGRTGLVCEADSAASLTSALQACQPLMGQAETRVACRARVGRYTVDAAAAGLVEAYRGVTMKAGQAA